MVSVIVCRQTEAHERLKGTVSKDKHEILYEAGINYNEEKEVYRRGSILVRQWSGNITLSYKI